MTNPWIQGALASLFSGDAQREAEAIETIGFYLERFWVVTGGVVAQGLGEAWTPEVASADLNERTVDLLVRAVQAFAMAVPGDRSHGAYWALSKLRRAALVPWLRERLHELMSNDPGTLYQCLVALEASGEDVFASKGGSWDKNAVQNMDVARAYLEDASEE